MRIALLAVLLLAPVASAQDKLPPPVPVERVTYRLTGLFAPDREKDLRLGFEEVPQFKLIGIDFNEAEITIEFVPAKLWPGQKPERVAELVSDTIRAATGHTFGVKPRRTVSRDKLKEVVIPASGIDCKACCLCAYESVAAIDGVMQATASFKEGRVTALIDPEKTDRAALEDALKKRGVKLDKK